MDLLDEINALSESIRTLKGAFLREVVNHKSLIKEAHTDIASLIEELIDLDSVLENLELDVRDDY